MYEVVVWGKFAFYSFRHFLCLAFYEAGDRTRGLREREIEGLFTLPFLETRSEDFCSRAPRTLTSLPSFLYRLVMEYFRVIRLWFISAFLWIVKLGFEGSCLHFSWQCLGLNIFHPLDKINSLRKVSKGSLVKRIGWPDQKQYQLPPTEDRYPK